MYADRPSILMVALLTHILPDALPILWVVHGYIRRQTVPRLRSDDVGEEDADCAVGAAGLDGLAGFEGGCRNVGVGRGGAEEAETDFSAFTEAVFELFKLVRHQCY